MPRTAGMRGLKQTGINGGGKLDIQEKLAMQRQEEMSYSLAARTLANSQLVPAAYKGKPGECEIALGIAQQTGLPPLMVMQNLYIVNGRPTWSGQACAAMLDASPKFCKREIVYVGEEGEMSYGAYVQAYDKELGKTVKGTLVTMQTAKDEGWLDKNGSKWQTMPAQMLAYRALAFFARVHMPAAMMGLLTPEEAEDIS